MNDSPRRPPFLNSRRLLVAAFLLSCCPLGHSAGLVTNIAVGEFHSLFIENDGSLWGMGYNLYGQLGLGYKSFAESRPQKPIVQEAVRAVAGGVGQTLFIKADGSLWGIGDNGYGQLGLGSLAQVLVPTQVLSEGVRSVSTGWKHTMVLKTDGSLWLTGDNNSRQLGDGTAQASFVPKLIIPSGVAAISAGGYHSLFIRTNGSLWAMGNNEYGQLGDDLTTGWLTNRPEQVVLSDVVAISGGAYHTLFIKSDTSLWGMGCNTSGQLGNGTYTNCATPQPLVGDGVVAASAGRFHSVFVKADGSLWCMGDNSYGQLGDGVADSTNRPIQLVAENVITAVAGDGFTLFLKSDGSLWAIGYNASMQLGDGFVDATCPFPEQVQPAPPTMLSVELLADKRLRCSAPSLLGGKYCLLQSQDPGQPMEQWAHVLTNSIYGRSQGPFSITLTNVTTDGAPRSFFRLKIE